MRRLAILPTFLILILGLTLSDTRPLAQSAGRSLVPAAILDPIIDEYSGEAAFRHVQLLAANRDRQPREYLESFFETTYLREQATDYGLDVAVEYFRSGEIWDAEEADLWLVEPEAKRLAGLAMVPAALAAGSTTAGVEAEVVYVGAGRDSDYAGRDVKGKIVLGSGSVTSVFRSAPGAPASAPTRRATRWTRSGGSRCRPAPSAPVSASCCRSGSSTSCARCSSKAAGWSSAPT